MAKYLTALADIARGKHSIGIQSKLLIMLLIVSVVSVLIAGAIGYKSGTNSLRDAEFARMTQLRESRAREITDFPRNITDAAAIVTHGATAMNSAREFSRLQRTGETPLPPRPGPGLLLLQRRVRRNQ